MSGKSNVDVNKTHQDAEEEEVDSSDRVVNSIETTPTAPGGGGGGGAAKSTHHQPAHTTHAKKTLMTGDEKSSLLEKQSRSKVNSQGHKSRRSRSSKGATGESHVTFGSDPRQPPVVAKNKGANRVFCPICKGWVETEKRTVPSARAICACTVMLLLLLWCFFWIPLVCCKEEAKICKSCNVTFRHDDRIKNNEKNKNATKN